LKVAYFVLGMHHSGASALSGVLSCFGLGNRADRTSSRDSTSKRDYGNNLAYQLNQRIFEETGSSWNDSNFNIKKIDSSNIQKYISEAIRIIESEYEKYEHFVVNDSRLCSLLPLWEPACVKLGITIKVIIPYQNPLEVSKSFEENYGCSVETSLILWSKYMLSSEFLSRNFQRIFLSLDDLLNDQENFIETLSAFSNQIVTDKIKHDIDNVLDVSIKQYNNSCVVFPPGLPEVIKEIVGQFNLKQFNNPHVFDQLRTEFFYHNEIKKSINDVEILMKRNVELTEQLEKNENEKERLKDQLRFADEKYIEIKQKTQKEILELKVSHSKALLNYTNKQKPALNNYKQFVAIFERYYVRKAKRIKHLSGIRKYVALFCKLCNKVHRKCKKHISFYKLIRLYIDTELKDRRFKRSLEQTKGKVSELIEQNKLKQAQEFAKKRLTIETNNSYLLSVLGCLYMRENNWGSAKYFWNMYQNKVRNGYININRQRYFNKPDLLQPFDILDVKEISSKTIVNPSRLDKKICVYTALFGEYDTLCPINKNDHFDFICFSDRHREVSGWKFVILEKKFDDNNLCAKEPKVMPHKYLHDYDYSLYLDASVFIYYDISPFISDFLLDEKFVMFEHPDRNCVYEEAEAIIRGLRANSEIIVDQIKYYFEQGLPRGTGLSEASFIWREHNDPEIKTFMTAWWEEILKFSKRDQLSLGFLMWRKNFRPKILSHKFGTARLNSYFLKRSHNVVDKPLIYIPYKSPVTFLYHEKYQNTASTKMRGKQLVDMLNKNMDYNITYTNDLNVKNSCVFLTKGLLKLITVEELRKLRQDNYFVAVDYVDDIPRKELHPHIDVYIASSILGYYYLNNRNKDKHVFLVSHHVDPELDEASIPIDKLRLGYFGETINALYHEELSDIVAINHIDTKNSNTEWKSNVSNYNMHYAVRNVRNIDGYKPFLKGFTASFYGANLLVPRSEGDAKYYLPPNYPFFVDDVSENSIRVTIEKINNTYGDNDWLLGIDCMSQVKERCSEAYICSEFENIFNYFSKN